MNHNHLSTELLFTTIPIRTNINNVGINGTAFIISIPTTDTQSSIPILVTNYHVIKGFANIYADFFQSDSSNGKPITSKKISLKISSSDFCINEQLDVAFIPIAPALTELLSKGIHIFYKSLDKNLVYSSEKEKSLAAIEEVTFIGYPYGLKEVSNNFPIARRGITATPIWSSDSDRTFLIDAGVFPGSSGSPVFIYNQGMYSDGNSTTVGTRLVFLGMIKSSIQENTSKQYIGLGEVIKANAIFNFIYTKLNLLQS